MSRKKLRTALLEEQNSEGRTKPHERKFREKRDEAMRAIKRQEGGVNWTVGCKGESLLSAVSTVYGKP